MLADFGPVSLRCPSLACVWTISSGWTKDVKRFSLYLWSASVGWMTGLRHMSAHWAMPDIGTVMPVIGEDLIWKIGVYVY